jgi:alpha-beta hydrolase superfamily lysophospholipase
MRRGWTLVLVSAVVGASLLAGAARSLSAAGAGALLHPSRRAELPVAPPGCVTTTFQGDGVTLEGWQCAATSERRGSLIFLHGVGDNRGSSAGVVQRYRSRGFDVVAYDSRAHGRSSGDSCTYGFYEKRDLSRVIDTLRAGPVVLLGTSLGAAVALQAAADDPRIGVVVAAETFSDLRTVATERAPFFFTPGTIERAFAKAAREGQFDVADVSPLRAASRIDVPVLLIHGDADRQTPSSHSRRVFDALQTRKRLILVPGKGHNQSLSGAVWNDIANWIDDSLRSARAATR